MSTRHIRRRVVGLLAMPALLHRRGHGRLPGNSHRGVQLNALYGAVLLKLREDLPAYDALHHAHQLNPQDSGTVDLLYMAALELARKSLATKSESAHRYSGSLRYFEEAAKLRPREPAPHQGMAEIYARTGRVAQATAEQQQAERLTRNLGKLQ